MVESRERLLGRELMPPSKSVQRPPADARLGRAVTLALDAMADQIPELLAMPDSRMLSLQVAFEEALAHALQPPTPGYRPARDRSL